jgi:hypothetical protein
MVKQSGYEAGFSVYGQRVTHNAPAEQLGRYAVDSTNPKIFADAMKMVGGGGGMATEAPSVSQVAAASMVTQPMEGETISDPTPTVKANLATMGDVDPKSVAIRVSGIGPVPAKYDPATKMVTAEITQKLREEAYTVILTATVQGKKVETRWSFKFNAKAAAAKPDPAR